MQEFLKVVAQLFTPGGELLKIIGVTLYMAFLSTTISACLGLPLGVLIGSRRFRGKGVLMRVLNTLMGLPPVVAGLLVFSSVALRSFGQSKAALHRIRNGDSAGASDNAHRCGALRFNRIGH